MVLSSTVEKPTELSPYWPIFFLLMVALTIVFFALPPLFGLQNFNQWGGMYDEHWCYAEMYDHNPHVVTGAMLKFERQNAGDTGTQRVYSGPMNNQNSCLMWAHSRCGKKSTDGWLIRWIEPALKGKHFIGGKNVCDLPLAHETPWFRYER